MNYKVSSGDRKPKLCSRKNNQKKRRLDVVIHNVLSFPLLRERYKKANWGIYRHKKLVRGEPPTNCGQISIFWRSSDRRNLEKANSVTEVKAGNIG